MRQILLIGALTLGFRAFNLLRLPMFIDEATYLWWGMDIWEQKTRAAVMIPIVTDGKQPLYMWLAGGTGQLFSDPLVAGRAVSILAGGFSAVGVYAAGRWLVSDRVGLLAGLLYAVVPYNLIYDRMALVEALLNAEGVWAFALSVFIVTRARKARSAVLAGLGLAVALGAGLWTKMPALFMVAFPFLGLLLLFKRERLSQVAHGFLVAAGLLAAIAGLMLLVPEMSNLLDKTQDFSDPLPSLLAFPIARWLSSAQRYWTWFTIYLPAPLWMMVVLAAVWGMVRRSRTTLLLLGCWAAFTMPILLLAREGMVQSRYVSQGVFLLFLLLAIALIAWAESLSTPTVGQARQDVGQRRLRQFVAAAVIAVLMAPAIWFDVQLLTTPETAPLAPTDRSLFVTSLTSGYGFREATEVVKKRALELTQNGQPVILLGNYYFGHTYAGLKLYVRGLSGVSQYVDGHLSRDTEGFAPAWRSHHVPILVVGVEGWDRMESFERAVPKAKRLGLFPKPGGESSFWVYEVGPDDLDP